MEKMLEGVKQGGMWCSQCPVIDIDHTHGKDAGGGEKMSNGTACGVHIALLLISTTRMEKMLEGVKQSSMWCSHCPVINIDCAHGKDAGGGQTGRRVVFTSPRYQYQLCAQKRCWRERKDVKWGSVWCSHCPGYRSHGKEPPTIVGGSKQAGTRWHVGFMPPHLQPSSPLFPPPLVPHSCSLHLAEFDGTMLVGGSWWARVALEIPAHIPQKRGGAW